MRFANVVGFVKTDNTKPGVWEPNFIERRYRGDVVTNIRRFENEEKMNNDVNVTNRISIVADSYILNNLHYLRYVCWKGQKWKVATIDIVHPRIILTLGGLYNGNETNDSSEEIRGFS